MGGASMGATSAGASAAASPSSTCTASASAPDTSHAYSPTSRRASRHDPKAGGHSPLSPGTSRSTGAVGGDSLTAWMASADAPDGARAMKGLGLVAASEPGVRKRRYTFWLADGGRARSMVTISPSGRNTQSRRASVMSLVLLVKSKARAKSPRAATTPDLVPRASGRSAVLDGVWLGA